MSKKFVMLNSVNTQGDVIGILLILPEDVRRVSVYDEKITRVLSNSKDLGLFHETLEAYLVQGNSTEVYKKLFGKTDLQQFLNKAKTSEALTEENTQLRGEEEKYVKMFGKTALQECQDKLEELSKHHQSLRELHGSLAKANVSLVDQNTRLKEENDNYVKMFEQTTKTEGELRDELARFKSMHSGQRIIIERMQDEAHQTESRMKEVSKEAYDLRDALNKMRLERDSLVQSLKEGSGDFWYRRWQQMEQEAFNFKRECEKKGGIITELEDSVISWEKLLNESEKRRNELEYAKVKLEEQLGTGSWYEQAMEAKKKLADAEELYKESQLAYGHLQQHVKALTVDRKRLEQSVVEYETKLRNYQEILDNKLISKVLAEFIVQTWQYECQHGEAVVERKLIQRLADRLNLKLDFSKK